MDKPDKYKAMKEFILENFSTTSNINDRLHIQDIFNILSNNKHLFSSIKMAQVFKSLNIGEHRSRCNICGEIQTGYYFIKYTGKA